MEVTILIIWALLIIYCYWQDTSLTLSEIVYKNRKIPCAFEGFRILQISDLHNAKFGKENCRLLKKIKEAQPDIIVVTGDVYDRRTPDLNVAAAFLQDAVKICPVYYISGNHENWSGFYAGFKMMIKDSGVILLDDTSVKLTRDGASIGLYGAADSSTNKKRSGKQMATDLEETAQNMKQKDEENQAHMENAALSNEERVRRKLVKLKKSQDTSFNILLSHRPELFPVYASQRFDLVFSGHAHGGQFRVPFIGGLYAPNQGLFPSYTSGIHTWENGTSMVVSRGLGNSQMPIRIFNRPEIVAVTLQMEKRML